MHLLFTMTVHVTLFSLYNKAFGKRSNHRLRLLKGSSGSDHRQETPRRENVWCHVQDYVRSHPGEPSGVDVSGWGRLSRILRPAVVHNPHSWHGLRWLSRPSSTLHPVHDDRYHHGPQLLPACRLRPAGQM